jgi:hypothetical protein
MPRPIRSSTDRAAPVSPLSSSVMNLGRSANVCAILSATEFGYVAGRGQAAMTWVGSTSGLEAHKAGAALLGHSGRAWYETTAAIPPHSWISTSRNPARPARALPGQLRWRDRQRLAVVNKTPVARVSKNPVLRARRRVNTPLRARPVPSWGRKFHRACMEPRHSAVHDHEVHARKIVSQTSSKEIDSRAPPADGT